MRWGWRPESGDWRFLTVDWPEELDQDGAIILDVDWDDNPYTDTVSYTHLTLPTTPYV